MSTRRWGQRLHPPSELERPVEQREWVTHTEAAAHVGCHPFTIRNWRRNGLLPNTRHTTRNRYLYLRADLERAAASERYHGLGVDYEKLLNASKDDRS